MTSGAFTQALHDWQGFYTLVGGAAATLTGLQFVAASLGTRVINDDADAPVRTFITPTVIYFSLTLLLSALMNIPNQTPGALAAQLVAVGCVGAAYSASHARRLKSFHLNGDLSWRGWLWNLVWPLFASLCLAVSGLAQERILAWAFDLEAFGIMFLVMVGLHNAWNVTLYLVRRSP